MLNYQNVTKPHITTVVQHEKHTQKWKTIYQS